jgi:hypothetical protein
MLFFFCLFFVGGGGAGGGGGGHHIDFCGGGWGDFVVFCTGITFTKRRGHYSLVASRRQDQRVKVSAILSNSGKTWALVNCIISKETGLRVCFSLELVFHMSPQSSTKICNDFLHIFVNLSVFLIKFLQLTCVTLTYSSDRRE